LIEVDQTNPLAVAEGGVDVGGLVAAGGRQVSGVGTRVGTRVEARVHTDVQARVGPCIEAKIGAGVSAPVELPEVRLTAIDAGVGFGVRCATVQIRVRTAVGPTVKLGVCIPPSSPASSAASGPVAASG
jgi:hypothetical protein